jgi:hypothetical protein
MTFRRRTLSIPQWANKANLADDGRSISAARGLIATGQGPEIVSDGQRHGVQLKDHDAWAQATPWAAYLAALPESERYKQQATAMKLVGDAKYMTVLYDKYCASQWRSQWTFEKWLKRRKSLKVRRMRKAKANNKGGGR